jgi:hypothetical protein
MIEKLKYRENLGPFSGTYRDVFDSEHFRTLLKTDVVVDGVKYNHKIGEFSSDIFIGPAHDGVALYRGLGAQQSRASITCYPIAVVVYSFDPTARTRLENIYLLGVIPGPRAPKFFNSFLHPFFEECRRGAIGIDTYNSVMRQVFKMHVYPIFNEADIIAAVKARGGKGPGAIIPCHECDIEGIRDPRKGSVTTYYLPHQRPDDEEPNTDYLLNNLKTHDHFVQVWHKLAESADNKEFEAIGKKYGVTCVPILCLLPSMDAVKSFPYGLMHQLFANTAPNMVLHWKGAFKELDSTHDQYVLDESVWKKIGLETVASARTTPSWMIRLMPDVFLHAGKYTCESWAFFITWLAPYLFEGRLPDDHYQHLLLFSNIVKLATSLEITTAMLEELTRDVKAWHAEYER